MRVNAGLVLQRGVHAKPRGRLDLAAVDAHVLNAGLRILGDVLRQGGVRRVVPTWRRNGHRNAVQALAGLQKVFAHDHDFLARRFLQNARLDRIGNGMVPSFADVFNFAAHAGAVNFAVRSKRTHHHGDVVLEAFAVGHIGEQKGFAIGLSNATSELPSHQGMHFSVFVDFAVHGDQHARAVKRCQMFVQIGIVACGFL